jgi:hypothetical protein
MGLIRTAVVVGAVVALMPTDRTQQLRLADQAGAAAKWTLTFCERNAATCTQAGEVWGVFVKKAQFAGQLAIDLVNDSQRSEPAKAEPARTEPAIRREDSLPAQPAAARGTLTPSDLKPSWRGAVARNG